MNEIKNPMTETAKKVFELCCLKSEADKIKKQIDMLEGYFLKLAEERLRDTKTKSITFMDGLGNKVTATMAANLKVIYPTFLKKIFGDCYKDVVKEEITYKVSDPAKRMLSGLSLKNYIEMPVAEVISGISTDDTVRKVLAKKVKGINFEKDKTNIMEIAGVSEEDASDYAFFVSEAAVWESFTRLMKVKETMTEEEIAEIIDIIDGAVITEETPKIKIEGAGIAEETEE